MAFHIAPDGSFSIELNIKARYTHSSLFIQQQQSLQGMIKKMERLRNES
jgi:hypothetical protein